MAFHARTACQTLKLMAVANFTDGTSLTTGSDLTWKARNGPITYDHLWHGEIYDANREVADWASSELSSLETSEGQTLTADGSAPEWSPVVAMSPIVGVLSPQLMPPIRIVQSFEPVSINATELRTFTPGWKTSQPFLRCHFMVKTENLCQDRLGTDIVKVDQKALLFSAGCEDGFDGGRFIRCPTCKGPAGLGVGGTLEAAVFFQSCRNELHHLTANSCSPATPIALVAPAVLAGWEKRYKGAFDCETTLPANKTGKKTVFWSAFLICKTSF